LTTALAFEEHFVVRGRNRLGVVLSQKDQQRAVILCKENTKKDKNFLLKFLYYLLTSFEQKPDKVMT